MNSTKKFKIIKAQKMSEGQGATVKRSFPGSRISHVDPFVLMDEFFVEPPAGFPFHPHRGFEAVTFMLEGGFKHEDTAGGKSIVREMGLQRVTMGKGVRHSEMPVVDGMNHGIQLWVNLPQNLKQIEPDYKSYQKDELPIIEENGKFMQTLIGDDSPVKVKTDVIYKYIELSDAEHEFIIERNYNGFIYLISGNATVEMDSQKEYLEEGQLLAKYIREEIKLKIKSEDMTKFIFVKGKPHNEPIRMRGSFVD
jgi:hypothetical protein